MHAPTSRPPALPPRIATRSRSAQPCATRCSAHAMVSVNVLRLWSSLPSRYQRRPSSPPPRGWTSAHTTPRSSSDSRATREPRRHRRLVGAVAVDDAGAVPSSGVSTWRTRSSGTRVPSGAVAHCALRHVSVEVDVRRRASACSSVRSPVASVVVEDRRRRRQRRVAIAQGVDVHSGLAPSSTIVRLGAEVEHLLARRRRTARGPLAGPRSTRAARGGRRTARPR